MEYPPTEAQRQALELEYNNRCAICNRQGFSIDNSEAHFRRLAVDHDHKTGRIRGLLCSSCNLGLGNFHDNQGFLAKAIRYLKKHPTLEEGIESFVSDRASQDLDPV